jgi:6-pyruvoyltetrahydropterin/6-carboxytetrahydropterin synthase
MLITKSIEIDMGHRVPNHYGKCRNLHGHRYKIEVGVDDKVITKRLDSSEGMVIDFSILKEVMMHEIDSVFDHGFVMAMSDDYRNTFHNFAAVDQQKIIFVDFIPTAENLAKHWYEIMREALLRHSIRISHVTVWETPTSTATYKE